MSQALTDKTFVVSLRGGFKIWVNKEQSIAIKEALEKGTKFIYTETGMFRADEVAFILSASEVEENEKIKQGYWKCEYGFYHKRYEECGHNLCNKEQLSQMRKDGN